MNRMPSRLVLLAMLTCACANTWYVPLRNPPAPMTPRQPEAVDVFTTSRIERPYAEVGVFWITGLFTGLEDVLHAMRSRAAAQGCDAIYVQSFSRSPFSVTCLMYTDQRPAGL